MSIHTNCLNCQTPVSGNFCSHCGQENRPNKLSVGQLLSQFFSGLLNYDGRLFRSIRLLFTRPAQLTFAYLEGKRMQYVNPVRFYLFTSAIYFLFSNYLFAPQLLKIESGDSGIELSAGNSSNEIREGFMEGFKEGLELGKNDSSKAIEADFESFTEYLAHQSTLPESDRSSAFELRFIEKFYQIKDAYGDDTSFVKAFGQEIYKRFPQMLLLALPLLAGISKLVFFRKRNYWYIDHLVFTLHLTTSLFIVLLVQGVLELIAAALDQHWIEIIASLLGLAWGIFYLISFKRFFEKGWVKTLLLFFWLGLWQTVAFISVFAVLLVVSFFNL